MNNFPQIGSRMTHITDNYFSVYICLLVLFVYLLLMLPQ